MHTSRRTVPKPVRRKGSLTYEIHPRVPKKYWAAVGATHVTRSLGTRDLAEAKRLVHRKMEELYIEWDRQLANGGGAVVLSQPNSNPRAPSAILNAGQICDLLRQRVVELENSYVAEHLKGRISDPGAHPARLADEYRTRLEDKIKTVEAKALLGEHSGWDWLLTFYEKSGVGTVERSSDLFAAMTRTNVETLQEILAHWTGLGAKPLRRPERERSPSSSPLLSQFCVSYLAERCLEGEWADTIRATVRDLIQVTEDKPVSAYGRTEAQAFKDVLLALPANWMKHSQLRHLGIVQAAERARSEGIARQSATTIRKKWTVLTTLFDYAAIAHDGVTNPFVAKALIVADQASENEQWDPFGPDELRALLNSDLPGHLYWLTWLALYSGARLNELCQLHKSLFRYHGNAHYIYFSSALRLKTRQKRSCVRSVPLHPELVRLGILDYVGNCEGPLFPGIREHKTGRLSDAPSRAFSGHLKRIGIKRPRLSFHSLRHTFAQEFKRVAPRDAEARERLLGHSVAGVAGRYGGNYDTEAHDMEVLIQRSALVEKVQFNVQQCMPTFVAMSSD